MHSTLIPGLPVQTFGLCVAIGVYLAWIVAERLSLRKDIGSLICILALAGIAGARAAHVVEYWREEAFAANPLSVFAVWNGGLVFYGGLVAAGIAFCVWCRAKKLNLLDKSQDQLFLCCCLLDLPPDVVAARLRITPNNVRVKKHRLKEQISKLDDPEYDALFDIRR